MTGDEWIPNVCATTYTIRSGFLHSLRYIALTRRTTDILRGEVSLFSLAVEIKNSEQQMLCAEVLQSSLSVSAVQCRDVDWEALGMGNTSGFVWVKAHRASFLSCSPLE